MNQAAPKVGILCGGGPAPGINSVIAAATIEAVNSGWEVFGIPDGFTHLTLGQIDKVRPLGIADVSRIHLTGGSILSISRSSLTQRDEGADDPDWRMHNTLRAIAALGLDALVTIGGDGTAYAASRLADQGGGKFRIAHVPKTIDNDLPLPGGAVTFGFETARHVGVEIVNNLMRDAITTHRWFFVVAMGRSAGHLALSISKAAGATLAIIGEEFPDHQKVSLRQIVDLLECSILKRRAHGRPFGVAMLSEGICLRLDENELASVQPNLERDRHGNLRLSEVHLHRILTDLVRKRFQERDDDVRIVAKTIGYELRCAPPIPFDIDYTRDLGHGAIEYLKRSFAANSPETGAMVTRYEGALKPVPLRSIQDPETGYTLVRRVNTATESYRVAARYMIRLEAGDLDDPAALAAIAAEAHLEPDAFRRRYGYLVGR